MMAVKEQNMRLLYIILLNFFVFDDDICASVNMSHRKGKDYIKKSQQQQQQQKQQQSYSVSVARTACLSVIIKPARLYRLYRT